MLVMESQNYWGWKRPPRSSSPTFGLTPPYPLNHTGKCLIYWYFGHFQGQWLHHFPGECSIQQRWPKEQSLTELPDSRKKEGEENSILKFYFKLHFTSSHIFKNPLIGSLSLSKMALLGSICLHQQTASRRTRSATSQPTLHSLSFQPKPPDWSLLLSSPQTTFSRKNTHKHRVRDLSQPCLWVVRRAQPSPAFPCEATAPLGNANPQGCGRFCFFPKRSPQLQHITCGNFSWILNGFWSHAVSCLHVTLLYYDWISCSFYRVVLS